jgi:hypothetical protein
MRQPAAFTRKRWPSREETGQRSVGIAHRSAGDSGYRSPAAPVRTGPTSSALIAPHQTRKKNFEGSTRAAHHDSGSNPRALRPLPRPRWWVPQTLTKEPPRRGARISDTRPRPLALGRAGALGQRGRHPRAQFQPMCCAYAAASKRALAAAGSAGRSFIIQPSTYAERFTVSGAASNAVFTASTVPATGA